MTDKDKLIILLKAFKIGFKDNGKIIRCEEGMDKVEGYSMFWTDFEFDESGKFIQMGAWE